MTTNNSSILFKALHGFSDASSTAYGAAVYHEDHIQELLPAVAWRHVPTDSNPADLFSRGVMADRLVDNSFWWKGPHLLSEIPDLWPNSNPTMLKTVPEVKVL